MLLLLLLLLLLQLLGRRRRLLLLLLLLGRRSLLGRIVGRVEDAGEGCGAAGSEDVSDTRAWRLWGSVIHRGWDPRADVPIRATTTEECEAR